MAFDPSLSPILEDRWTPGAARHVLQRAGFGGDHAAINRLHAMGLQDAVASLTDPASISPPNPPEALDPDVIKPYSADERVALRKARQAGDPDVQEQFRQRRLLANRNDRQMFRQLQQWWLELLCDTDAPNAERLVLLWHNHFATGHRAVRDTFLMYQQNAMFREHAFAFDELARRIVRDPAMLKYLNNDRNNRRSPNENLARELLELFTLGEGNYAEADIKEGARALTGYGVDDNAFRFRKAQHDRSSKTILGRKEDFDGDGFVQLLLRQEACCRFVALKLYGHFVYGVGDDWGKVPRDRQKVILALGRLIQRHEYDLVPVLRTLLTSRHFHDPANVGKLIRSPAHLVAGTARTLGTPKRSTRVLNQAMESMGQVLFEPPSVNGWDGGRAWINTSTLFVRQNTAVYLITGKRPNEPFENKAVRYDPTSLLDGLEGRSPQAVVDRLADVLVGEHVGPDRRRPLYDFAEGRRNGADEPQALIGLLCMITAMPEYQLC